MKTSQIIRVTCGLTCIAAALLPTFVTRDMFRFLVVPKLQDSGTQVFIEGHQLSSLQAYSLTSGFAAVALALIITGLFLIRLRRSAA